MKVSILFGAYSKSVLGFFDQAGANETPRKGVGVLMVKNVTMNMHNSKMCSCFWKSLLHTVVSISVTTDEAFEIYKYRV